jgi:prevent-host-death family protein
MATLNNDYNNHINGVIMQSASVGIRDAKMHLSKYIKMVQRGVEVIITDRGRPVGKIVPIQNKDLTLEERIKVLEDQGLIEKKPAKHMKKIPSPIPVSDNTAQKFLQEDREYGQ